jgi:hypothetical protein
MRYVYALLLAVTHPGDTIPRALSWYEKTACAAAVFSLIAATAPFGSRELKTVLLGIALGMLVISFALDLYWRLLRAQTPKITKRPGDGPSSWPW